MKTNPRCKQRFAARSANEKLLKDCHDVMTDAINEWNTPDSPEAFCWSMKGIMVLRDRIAARLGLFSEQPCASAIIGATDADPDHDSHEEKTYQETP